MGHFEPLSTASAKSNFSSALPSRIALQFVFNLFSFLHNERFHHMPFQDDVAATLAGNAGPAGPTTAPAPPEDTNTVAAPTTLAPPAQPTSPAPRPMQPAVATQEPSQEPGHFFKHLSHAFAGALVGALAG